jgi:hypothetical protein
MGSNVAEELYASNIKVSPEEFDIQRTVHRDIFL